VFALGYASGRPIGLSVTSPGACVSDGIEKSIRLLAASREESLQKDSRFGGENAGYNLDAMVEFRGREDFETGTEGAALRVVGGIYEAWDAALNDSAGAHGAGLQRNVKCGVG